MFGKRRAARAQKTQDDMHEEVVDYPGVEDARQARGISLESWQSLLLEQGRSSWDLRKRLLLRKAIGSEDVFLTCQVFPGSEAELDRYLWLRLSLHSVLSSGETERLLLCPEMLFEDEFIERYTVDELTSFLHELLEIGVDFSPVPIPQKPLQDAIASRRYTNYGGRGFYFRVRKDFGPKKFHSPITHAEARTYYEQVIFEGLDDGGATAFRWFIENGYSCTTAMVLLRTLGTPNHITSDNALSHYRLLHKYMGGAQIVELVSEWPESRNASMFVASYRDGRNLGLTHEQVLANL